MVEVFRHDPLGTLLSKLRRNLSEGRSWLKNIREAVRKNVLSRAFEWFSPADLDNLYATLRDRGADLIRCALAVIKRLAALPKDDEGRPVLQRILNKIRRRHPHGMWQLITKARRHLEFRPPCAA